MNRRPALRAALLAVAATVAGFGVLAGYLGWYVYRYEVAQGRATAVAEGTVIEDSIGDYGDIRVRWFDGAGREHVQRFAIYDTDRYTRGRAFTVAYDPADPAPRGLPADPDETSAEDDLIMPIVIAAVLAALLVLAWALRGLLYRRAAGRAGRPTLASLLSGEADSGMPALLGASTWVALADPGRPDEATRWQRVMWHPAADTAGDQIGATVHGDPASRGRVVVEMSDGARLVPIGRLRHRPPRRVLLDARGNRRVDLRDSFILPAGTPLPVPRWWLRGLMFALAGAGIGGVTGFLIAGGGVAVLPFTAATSALLVNGWALAGAEP